MAIILDGTKGETFPSWTTAGRPATPSAGQQGYNSTLGAMEYYSGSSWVSSAATTSASDLTSGTLPAARLPTGSVLQVVQATKVDAFTSTSATMVDITGLSLSITPSSASSKILVFASITGSGETWNAGGIFFNLVRNSTALNVSTAGSTLNGTALYNAWSDSAGDTSGNVAPLCITYLDSPATTSATTYKIQGQIGLAGYTFAVNRRVSNAAYGGSSTIIAMEIAG